MKRRMFLAWAGKALLAGWLATKLPELGGDIVGPASEWDGYLVQFKHTDHLSGETQYHARWITAVKQDGSLIYEGPLPFIPSSGDEVRLQLLPLRREAR